MRDTGQQVTQSALVDHKFQRLGLRASAFLNSNNGAIVFTPCFVLETHRHVLFFIQFFTLLFCMFCSTSFFFGILFKEYSPSTTQ